MMRFMAHSTWFCWTLLSLFLLLDTIRAVSSKHFFITHSCHILSLLRLETEFRTLIHWCDNFVPDAQNKIVLSNNAVFGSVGLVPCAPIAQTMLRVFALQLGINKDPGAVVVIAVNHFVSPFVLSFCNHNTVWSYSLP